MSTYQIYAKQFELRANMRLSGGIVDRSHQLIVAIVVEYLVNELLQALLLVSQLNTLTCIWAKQNQQYNQS